MTIDPMTNLRTIDLGDETIQLDPGRLQFNETSLSDFFENISLWYDYYSSKCAKAESLFANAETAYENKYMEKFLTAKSEGISDKGADASAKLSPETQAAQKQVNSSKAAHKQIREYLKALDKAHEMALNRGYMLRKEMDKLHTDISFGKKEINVDDILGSDDSYRGIENN